MRETTTVNSRIAWNCFMIINKCNNNFSVISYISSFYNYCIPFINTSFNHGISLNF